MYDCAGCGKPKCTHSQLYCSGCMKRTTREVVIKDTDLMLDPRLTNILEPGESVYSEWIHPTTGDRHITIRREVN